MSNMPETQSQGAWEEEGLFWRGPKPPVPSDSTTGETWEEKDWIEIPHEHYIPLSKFRLNEILWQFPKVQQSRREFKHFLSRIDSVYHFHYHALLDELKSDYEFFDPDGGALRRRLASEDELHYRENRFLTNFLRTMTRGNFLPFTEKQVEDSNEYTYLFDLKVRVLWDRHEPELMQNFTQYVNNSPDAAPLRKILEVEKLEDYLQSHPDYKDHVWLFWRGIDYDRRQAAQPMQKLDIWISSIFGKLFFPIQRMVELLRGERRVDKELVQDVMEDVGRLASLLTFGLIGQEKQQEKQQVEEGRSVVFERRWVRRLNMQNQPVSLRDLFSPKTLQEPELDRVICLFRKTPDKNLLAQVKEKLQRKKNAEAPEKDQSIYIKMFKKIPLADAEVILPFKKPTMKSFDMTLIGLTGVGSLYALYKGLQSGGRASFVIMAVLLGLFFRMLMGYLRTVQRYNARMISELYEKNLDNHTGVLQYLVDSIEEQEYKESVLAYYMLWLQDEPMTEEQLDGAIEEFLKQYFDGIEIDFEVDDALKKLVIRPHEERDAHHLPLIEEIHGHDGQLYYRALPLNEALEIMDAKWEQLNRQRLEEIGGIA
ncbi:MAG: DUF3754 domain-containing protein [Myxococcales bacterium]|nr:DUF3754 domain-containing protein [Myxococcales bacterium]